MGLLGSLGSLNVLLSADTAQFSSAMDKAAFQAEKSLKKIGFSAKVNSAIITTALTAAVTAFAVKMRNIVDSADEMGKSAQKIGITVEQLSKLKYAAELSGVSMETLQQSFIKMNKAAFESPKVFERFGVSVKNDITGGFRSGYDILLDFSDVVSRMPDGIGKANAITQAFGKSAAEMTPLFNSGGKTLREFGEEAERIGIVIDTKTAKSAEVFNDNMLRLLKNVDGAFLSIGSKLIPTLSGLTENMMSAKDSTDAFSEAGKGLAVVLVSIINSGMVLTDTFKAIIDGIGAGAAQVGLFVTGQFAEAVKVGQLYAEDQTKRFEDLATKLAKNWDLLEEKAASGAQNAKDSMSGPMLEFTNSMEDNMKRIQKVGDGVGNAFGKALDSAVLDGMKFKDVMVNLLKDVEAAIFKTMVSNRLAEAISGGITSFFSPAGATATKTVKVTPSKHGNVFNYGDVVPFANGGVISSPVSWPMTGGKRGLAGEAGPEAIMPLFRTGGGDLGVKGSGGSVTVNVYAPEGSNVKQERSKSGGNEQINIMIDEATAGAVGNPGSKTYKALRSSFGLKQSLTSR